MAAKLDHLIVLARDKQASAAFLAEILGLPAPVAVSHFVGVVLGDGLSLDFANASGDLQPQHYAFAVSEPELDAVIARVRARNLPFWADPQQTRPGEIAQRGDGRALYFADPSGHWLEVLSR